jgi:glycosyltransferase involved in cell wall biosynthesis
MARVLYLIQAYPQISETYMHTEIDRVQQHHEVTVATLFPPDIFYEKHAPFIRLKDQRLETYAELVRQVRPDIVHGHYLHLAPALRFLARQSGTFFTMRAHSFDVLGGKTLAHPDVISALNDPVCRGVLCFPFSVDLLRAAGVDPLKVHPCWPVVDLKKFRNRAPNGDAVMNVGAALPKKAMDIYVDLAACCPSMRFDLYMLGYDATAIVRYAEASRSPVRIMPLCQPDDMPAEYKNHRWLVYTASKGFNTVGWPLSVAEAQASGVGVLLQNIRPDIGDYVGPGGYVFDTVDDAVRIISQPFPEEKREISFLHAEKSDVDSHIGLLYQLWS